MNNTLTERYLHEVVRRIPADQRDDVAEELRTTIADTVEGRAEDSAEAEREVIAEMGDPIRLAASYAGRPLALIGPDLYPAYIRLVTLLLSTVLPVVVGIAVVVDVIDNKGFGAIIGSAIGATITVGTHIFAWLTVIFAVIERTGASESITSTDPWTPEDLPELRDPDKGGFGACASVVWNALLIGLIIWQHIAEPYRLDGQRLEVLHPDLWSGWIWPILIGLGGVVVLEIVRIARRSWTMPLAAGYAVAEATVALPLAWILYDQQFFNPAFLDAVNGDSWMTPDSFYSVAALVVLATTAFEIIKRFREARR